MKKNSSTWLLIVGVLIGSTIFLYPDVSTYWNALHQTRVVANYQQALDTVDENQYQEVWQAAEAYNAQLAARPEPEYVDGEPVDPVYQSLFQLGDSGVMGVLEIDKINLQLPIYHGTSQAVLAIGVGHLEGSSLPTGGEGSHAVLTGHRGLATSTLFTNLDLLEVGDVFTITAFSEVLTYAVDQVRIVKPDEVEELAIVAQQDYCTLVTCTPIGINSHRLLVRGTRIASVQAQQPQQLQLTSQATIVDPLLVAGVFAVPLFIIVFISCLFTPSKQTKRAA